MANLISVDYLTSNHPTLDTSLYSSATISGIISAASSYVANYLRYDPTIGDVTDEVRQGFINQYGNLVVYPTKLPINSVSAFKISFGQTDINLSITGSEGSKVEIPVTKDYISYPARELSFDSISVLGNFAGLKGREFYTKISYNAGYETIPEDMKYAVSLIAMDKIVRNQNVSGAQSIKQGEVTITYPTGRSGKSDNVLDAEAALSTYKRIT